MSRHNHVHHLQQTKVRFVRYIIEQLLRSKSRAACSTSDGYLRCDAGGGRTKLSAPQLVGH